MLKEVKKIYNGEQKLYKFSNGYGASVVKHDLSYGLELAVIKWEDNDFNLVYDTEITEDVLGHLKEEEIQGILDDIEAIQVSKYYALHIDGFLSYLGQYMSLDRCIEDNQEDYAWYWDERTLVEFKQEILERDLLMKEGR